MEKNYYPSKRKVAIHNYLYPVLETLIIIGIVIIIYSYNNEITSEKVQTLLIPIIALPFLLLFRLYIDLFIIKHLVITVTSSSVLGPVHRGRKIPILFTEMDFRKTFKTKMFCSIHGDEMKFEERFFESKDVKEIWEIIKKHENQNRM